MYASLTKLAMQHVGIIYVFLIFDKLVSHYSHCVHSLCTSGKKILSGVYFLTRKTPVSNKTGNDNEKEPEERQETFDLPKK